MVLQISKNFETNKTNEPYFYGLPWNDAHGIQGEIQMFPSWQVNVVMGMMLYLYLATTDYLGGEIYYKLLPYILFEYDLPQQNILLHLK